MSTCVRDAKSGGAQNQNEGALKLKRFRSSKLIFVIADAVQQLLFKW